MFKQRKSRMQTIQARPIQRKHAAGIDIGATSIYVAVPGDRDPQSVRSFQTFTEDLHRLADWLQRCRVKTVDQPEFLTALPRHEPGRLLLTEGL